MARFGFTCTCTWLLCSLTVAFPALGQSPPTPQARFDATEFGAKADGKTDDTAAIQKALDAAASRAAWSSCPRASTWWPAASRSRRAWHWSASKRPRVYIEPLHRHGHLRHRRPRQRGRPRALRAGRLRHRPGLDRLLSRAETRRHPPLRVDLPSPGWRQHRRERHPHQQLQRHQDRPEAQRAPPHPQRLRLRPARAASGWTTARHRPHRERPVALPLVVIEAGRRRLGQGLRVHVEELRGLHLRPHRLGVRHQHLHLPRQHRLPLHRHRRTGP